MAFSSSSPRHLPVNAHQVTITRVSRVESTPSRPHTYSARHPTSLSLARSYEIRLDPLAS